MSSRTWTLVRFGLGLLILALVARTFARNWNELTTQDLNWTIRPAPLVASVLLVWAMYALLIAAWRAMLETWGDRLPLWQAARIWTVSSLGKYVPGKVWAIAGMALLAKQAGVSAWSATASAVLLQVLAVGTGALVAALSGTHALEAAQPGMTTALWLGAIGSAVAIAVLLSPGVTTWLLRLVVRDAEPRAPGIGPMVLGLVANLVAWGGYGISLWLLARAVLPETGLTPVAAIGAFAASYVAGLLFLLAPGGLGVREGVFIVLLQGSIGLAAATGLALASRLLLTVTELGATVPFLLFPQGVRRGVS